MSTFKRQKHVNLTNLWEDLNEEKPELPADLGTPGKPFKRVQDAMFWLLDYYLNERDVKWKPEDIVEKLTKQFNFARSDPKKFLSIYYPRK